VYVATGWKSMQNMIILGDIVLLCFIKQVFILL